MGESSATERYPLRWAEFRSEPNSWHRQLWRIIRMVQDFAAALNRKEAWVAMVCSNPICSSSVQSDRGPPNGNNGFFEEATSPVYTVLLIYRSGQLQFEFAFIAVGSSLFSLFVRMLLDSHPSESELSRFPWCETARYQRALHQGF